jgi:chromosome segregation ATPase
MAARPAPPNGQTPWQNLFAGWPAILAALSAVYFAGTLLSRVGPIEDDLKNREHLLPVIQTSARLNSLEEIQKSVVAKEQQIKSELDAMGSRVSRLDDISVKGVDQWSTMLQRLSTLEAAEPELKDRDNRMLAELSALINSVAMARAEAAAAVARLNALEQLTRDHVEHDAADRRLDRMGVKAP